MRIIRKGRIPTEETQNIVRFECNYCGTIFEANGTEYTTTTTRNFDKTKTECSIKCPICKKTLITELLNK